MAISPIVLNGTIGISQNVSAIKSSDDNQAALVQQASIERNDEEVEEKLHRVNESQEVTADTKGFDASEKGANSYQGDGGRNRRKHMDGRVIKKSKGGFDITV